MESKRIFGNIEFPDEEKKIEHIWLNVAESSIYLEVPMWVGIEKTWPVLIGTFIGMGVVTFVNCRSDGGSYGDGGSFKRIYISYYIKGYQAQEAEFLMFQRVILTSPALNDWISLPRGIVNVAERTYQIPEHESILKIHHEDLTLEVGVEYPLTVGSNDLHSDRVCSIDIQFEEPVNMDRISTAIQHIKKLILFLTYKNPEFSKYYVFSSENDSHELVNNIEPLNDTKFTQQIKVHYADVKNQLEDITTRWFQDQKIHPVIDLLLQKCYNPKMSTAAYFLNVCVAIESFHRRFGKTKNKKAEIDNPENRVMIQQMIEKNGNLNLLRWFNEKSTEWEKPQLKERLQEFTETLTTVFADYKASTLEEIITKTVQTRNEIVHKGEATNRFNYVHLFMVTKGLEFTMRLEVLRYLGMDIDNKRRSLINAGRASLRVLLDRNKTHL